MSENKISSVEVSNRLRSNNFDGLRLVFASMVVLFHIGILTQNDTLYWMTKYISSTFAVQAFFFVSGFLIFMSYERSDSMFLYFKKRFFRIIPAYVLVVFVSAFLLVGLSELSAFDYFRSLEWWRYLFYNLMLANFSAPTLPGVFLSNAEPTVNGSLWTIKIEVAFYIMVPFLVWLIKKFGYKKVLFGVFLLSVMWKCGFYLAEMVTGNVYYLKFSKQLPGQLSFFVGGAYAYYRTRNGMTPVSGLLALLGVIGYVFSEGVLHQFLAPFCVTLIVYWAAIKLPFLWSAKKHGDISYGLYLFHFPVVQALIAIGALEYLSAYPFLGISLFMSFVLAKLSWIYVENVALKFAHD